MPDSNDPDKTPDNPQLADAPPGVGGAKAISSAPALPPPAAFQRRPLPANRWLRTRKGSMALSNVKKLSVPVPRHRVTGRRKIGAARHRARHGLRSRRRDKRL